MVHFRSSTAVLLASTNRNEAINLETDPKTANLWGVSKSIVFQQVEVSDVSGLTALNAMEASKKSLSLDEFLTPAY